MPARPAFQRVESKFVQKEFSRYRRRCVHHSKVPGPRNASAFLGNRRRCTTCQLRLINHVRLVLGTGLYI
ncbi:unnamed protein product [Tenebrio molitor]|nr:unnamed protein product [Tenebrio molitor]